MMEWLIIKNGLKEWSYDMKKTTMGLIAGAMLMGSQWIGGISIASAADYWVYTGEGVTTYLVGGTIKGDSVEGATTVQVKNVSGDCTLLKQTHYTFMPQDGHVGFYTPGLHSKWYCDISTSPRAAAIYRKVMEMCGQ